MSSYFTIKFHPITFLEMVITPEKTIFPPASYVITLRIERKMI